MSQPFLVDEDPIEALAYSECLISCQAPRCPVIFEPSHDEPATDPVDFWAQRMAAAARQEGWTSDAASQVRCPAHACSSPAGLLGGSPGTSREAYVATVRDQIAGTARALIAREIAFLIGVRRLAELSHEFPTRSLDGEFTLFVAIHSQSDHIPHPEMRALCSPSWLEKCDREIEDLERFYAREVYAACERLIGRIGGET